LAQILSVPAISAKPLSALWTSAALAPLKACRLYGAKLVIAKIDRPSRDAHFLLGLEKALVERP
jgi:hypothetical protein